MFFYKTCNFFKLFEICFGDLYVWCEGRFLEIDPPPPPIHRPITSPLNPLLHPRCSAARCSHLMPLQ